MSDRLNVAALARVLDQTEARKKELLARQVRRYIDQRLRDRLFAIMEELVEAWEGPRIDLPIPGGVWRRRVWDCVADERTFPPIRALALEQAWASLERVEDEPGYTIRMVPWPAPFISHYSREELLSQNPSVE